ncbi:uncharacterized protein LOC143857059 [Tasmannia lanceolata]|uniref:uncharacterized protein LOC143857059 n=1 Tax=Tasmannia lanceolata TaxID=3420 RepID=UPI004063D758
MDFITGLPMSEGKDVIMVVVDRLTKYAHFVALTHPYTASTVARLFFDNIFKLHGLPSSIVSDRGKMTPYEALYGEKPQQLAMGSIPTTSTAGVEDHLHHQAVILQLLKDNLATVRERMKHFADKKRTEREFQRIGAVAYKLQLPSHSKIHSVFHVSLLKRKIGDSVVPIVNLPEVGSEGQLLIEPVAILDRRIVRKGNVAVTQVLVQWANAVPEDATWEEWAALNEKFPDFHP